MELSDSFEVNHPIPTVWGVLTDVERIAPCLPGAQLTGTEGDEFHGVVKVKVGPVTSQYKGTASFEELDESARRAVISARGRDTRGAGNASARITVQLDDAGGGSTRVSVNTDLTVTGKVAQFGRGVMADVSRKLMGQFAANLANLIDETGAHGPEAAGAPSAEAQAGEAQGSGDVAGDGAAGLAKDAAEDPAPAGSRAVPAAGGSGSDEVEAVDLLAVAGGSVMRRIVPWLVVVVAVVVVLLLIL